MNNDWEMKKLGEAIKLEYGKPLPDSKRNPNGRYPVYGANGEKDRTDEYYYDKQSIIVGRKGSAGEINLTEKRFWPLDVTYFVTCDDKKYDLKFLYYLLGNLELPKLAKGVKPGINRNEVYSIDALIPSLPEQQRIVTILNEAFAAIAKAKETAEKNLQNAREVFESYLQNVFANPGDGWMTKTLGQVGKLQTGTTPKSSEKGMKGTFIPFIKPGDFVKDGTLNYDNEGLSKLGLSNSRLIKAGSALMVCIGATIGKTGFCERDIATNQQINSITPKEGISGKFLFYQMLTKRLQERVIHYSGQATLPIINKSKWGALTVVLPPTLEEQQRIVSKLDSLSAETKHLETIYQQKLADLDELKKSILRKAFAGELTVKPSTSNVISFPKAIPNITATDLQAGIIAIAYEKHKIKGKQNLFGRTKAEKIVHLAEAWAGINLDRNPTQMAAGPADLHTLDAVVTHAEKKGYFTFKNEGDRYTLYKKSNFQRIIEMTRNALGELNAKLDTLISLTLDMGREKIEVLATVFSAWNNLLLSNQSIADEAIVKAARENWHEAKKDIQRPKFFEAIEWMKKNNMVPEGTGKLVSKGPLL